MHSIYLEILFTTQKLENKVTQYINLKNVNSNLEKANCKLIEENEILKFENDELNTYKKFAKIIQSPENQRYKFIPAQENVGPQTIPSY